MAGNTSLITQNLKETAARNCHSCGSQFRGDRRRHVECHLSVCNKCFCQYSAIGPQEIKFILVYFYDMQLENIKLPLVPLVPLLYLLYLLPESL